MKILAVDSCTAVATCALTVGDTLVAEVVLNNKKTHSVKLLPLIEAMLKNADTDISEIDYFAVTTGPGSFTGQRIGISTVKGLAHATKKPCVAVSSLEALAYNLPSSPFIVCPILDARRDQVYTASFEGLERLTPDRAIALSELLSELDGRDVIFLGDGVPVFKETIEKALGKRAHFPPPHLIHLRGGSVATAAIKKIAENKVCDYNLLTPFYLRVSQAEREYLEKSGRA
ncbi:MAG: tRNA threonylcarbamoyladenosine biosynthesis protein TsaB [Firmicutes bacterium ADurb.Bin193]|nr:MAG: tRNA threonylcarbamoyladenosine biosynthesis protein TsaB [Firmicutes bacterium ADurb.Bin193]